NDRLYIKSHEWIERDGDTVTIGITDHAQESLGDLVFVELPETGESLSAGDVCAVVESVKAASDIYAPLTGEVTAVNEELADSPELINEDPYGEGWLMKMSITDEAELDDFLDAEAYQAVVDEEEG
ncbi:MAG TPA: glycine cleavage system protein GcvH, partial [Salinisphaeraceae bacterium]|nr:glycine cleavage system protein GcvH [Salinisphaeraceae bacterium]